MTPNSNQEEIWWLDPVYWDERILNEDDVAGMAFDYPCIREIVNEAERRTWEEMKQMCLDTCINFEEMGEFMKNWPWNSCANSLINKIDAKLKSLS